MDELDSSVSERQGFLFGEWKTFLLEHKGLEKGDPLPLYLFVVVMEALLFFLEGSWRRCVLGFEVVGWEGAVGGVAHLHFGDDTLIFVESCADRFTYLC